MTSITPFCSTFIVNFEQVDVSWESVLCGRTFFLKKDYSRYISQKFGADKLHRWQICKRSSKYCHPERFIGFCEFDYYDFNYPTRYLPSQS